MTWPSSISRTQYVAILVGVAVVALTLRVIFPAADPPWNPSVGVVWHDEGAWVHNARNKALFGQWTMDAWNPMYIAPVFTGLEYASFKVFGVGVRQARLVSELTGMASVLLLAWGIGRLAGREAAAGAGALLASNYVYVMYDRAAIMEASMVAFMVASWYCYVRAQTDPRWGWPAAACALLAFFTKAAAAFFVAAIGCEAILTWFNVSGQESPAQRRAAFVTLAALVVCGVVAIAAFVLPNWTDYRFYNWQMSVTRKPSYDLKSLVDRITWFPILHDIFTRMWFTLVVGTIAVLGLLTRWRSTSPPERLFGLWIGIGAFELMLHDVGNERRFLIFVPALVGLTAIVLGRDRSLLPKEASTVPLRRALLGLPLVLFALYVVGGTLVRLTHLYEIGPNVRLAAGLAALLAAAIYATWPWTPRQLATTPWTPVAGLLVVALVSAGQLAQFVQWAAGRTYKNYIASVELGRVLPPGTLVHGKLANGLALENRIRPIFVGRGFGNYDDRKTRDDVRYILTYIAPSLGYESQARNPVIRDVLDAYPDRRLLMTFDVAETTSGHDRAALFDKFGSTLAGLADATGPAQPSPDDAGRAKASPGAGPEKTSPGTGRAKN
jgi:4-amino-4-deoxy-L-arabinose transferase-like glycosyltransferase